MFRAKRRTAGRKNFAPALYSPNTYPTRLSFYDLPPLDEITLEEFESFAIDRLRILIEIESGVLRSKSFRDIEQTIRPLLLKWLPLTPSSATNAALTHSERRKDHYSHYILRLVFCRTEELRRKFVKNEVILFKVRYHSLQPAEHADFIAHYADKLPWVYMQDEERASLMDDLVTALTPLVRQQMVQEAADALLVTREAVQARLRAERFIKVPFEKVGPLVALRLVLVRDGSAYIPAALQLTLVAQEFADELAAQLMRTFQLLPRLEEDDRLVPLLQNLLRNFASVEYDDLAMGDAAQRGDINAASVTTPLMMRHFPMCARHLVQAVQANLHLKYQGRQQLGLFLKGIGLSVDEALKFWAHQFTKGGMSTEKFNKEYRYNIRHNYGLEGARINYKPPDCGRIMLKPKPGKGEYHGCPYRDLPIDALTLNLQELGIRDHADINGVLDNVEKMEYTVACTRVFELTHKADLDRARSARGEAAAATMHISHPNLYFDRSRQLERA